MFKLHRTLLAAAALVAVTTSTQAAPIVGQLGFGQDTGTITTTPGGPLNTAGILINMGAQTDSTIGLSPAVAQNFSVVAPGTAVTFAPTTINTANLAGLVLTFAGAGSFTAAGGSITVSSPDLIKIVLNGTYDTSGATAGFDDNAAVVSLTFQRVSANDAITFTGSLSTSAAVPEPSSVALAGIGLAAAGLFSLRKRLAK